MTKSLLLHLVLTSAFERKRSLDGSSLTKQHNVRLDQNINARRELDCFLAKCQLLLLVEYLASV